MLWFWRYYFVFLALSVVLVVAANLALPDNKLHVVFCDVGQGDGILIYQKATQVVIDAGPGNAILKCLSDHLPFWDRKIELLILTNPDRDHYGGMIEVFRRYKVESFVSPGIKKEDASFIILEQEAAREKAAISSLITGQDIKIGGISLQTLWPTSAYLLQETSEEMLHPGGVTKVLGSRTPQKADSVNQTSLVFKLTHGEFDVLLTGDIAPPATDELVSLARGRLAKLEVEVLKVPHHGSKNGLTESLLDAAKPRLAVVSVGKNNRYGHPHEEVIKLLKDRAVKILRTDIDGEIEIVTDGKKWEIKD